MRARRARLALDGLIVLVAASILVLGAIVTLHPQLWLFSNSAFASGEPAGAQRCLVFSARGREPVARAGSEH